jgi:glutamate formiminotransferase
VKALGLTLASRDQAQVSMNLTDFEVTPMRTVYDAIQREAFEHGTTISASEIIGLIPRAALDSAPASYLRIEGFEPGMILENRLESLLALE